MRDDGTTAQQSSTPFRTPYVVLLAIFLAAFMQLLDVSIVSVALPSIAADLNASSADLQLVSSTYTILFAATLITAAQLGNRYGRSRVFRAALIGFVLFSIACGAAPSALVLIISRGLQGICAGAMSAQTFAIIGLSVPRDKQGQAFGLYGAVIGLATICGPLLGGAIVQANVLDTTWRGIFWVNVPIGVAALVVGMRHLPRWPGNAAARLDGIGAFLSAATLFLIIYPLTEGRDGNSAPWIPVLLVLAALALAALLAHEARLGRRGGEPAMSPGIFRDRVFSLSCLASVLLFGGLVAFFFTFSLTLQVGFNVSPLDTGLVTFVFAIGSSVGSLISDRVTRMIANGSLVLGAALLAISMTALATVVDTSPGAPTGWPTVAVLLVGGLGLGLFVAPQQSLVMRAIDPRNISAASGLLPTMQQIGSAVGIALIGLLFFDKLSAKSSVGRSSGALEANAYRVVEHASLIALSIAFAVVAAISLFIRGNRQPNSSQRSPQP